MRRVQMRVMVRVVSLFCVLALGGQSLPRGFDAAVADEERDVASADEVAEFEADADVGIDEFDSAESSDPTEPLDPVAISPEEIETGDEEPPELPGNLTTEPPSVVEKAEVPLEPINKIPPLELIQAKQANCSCKGTIVGKFQRLARQCPVYLLTSDASRVLSHPAAGRKLWTETYSDEWTRVYTRATAAFIRSDCFAALGK